MQLHVDHNPHEPGSSKHGEHEAVFDLAKHEDATHVAINDGSWFDPATWANGEVPGNDARVVISHAATVTYDDVSNARLFTVRVDGELSFATDQDSKMLVDTLVVDGAGALIIGTEEQPVEADVSVDIVIANNGAIDVTWDPQLLSRGVVSHGEIEIHGQEKTTHLKVATDPMAGDTSIILAEAPEGWKVGDTLVLAGTNLQGYKWSNDLRTQVYREPEDEILTIARIEGNEIFFDTPLQYDHDSPQDDLKTSVANYSRNVTFSTEDSETAAVHERGHVMFMHNDDVDVRYAAFEELGRTDKSIDAKNVSEFEEITVDANVKGRYAFHFHRTGTEDQDNPALAIGNAVWGSPGWGYAHHDSHAIFHANASYGTLGAGFVAESGNETGAWTDNIAIYAKGAEFGPARGVNKSSTFDTGRSGDGFFFQSRMVESSGNIAASVENGFVYFHRGAIAEDAQLTFDASVFDLPEALGLRNKVAPDDAPILLFQDNEVIASKQGLQVVKANPNQGHDVHSHLKGFTAWNVSLGAQLEYTSHYVIEDFDIIGVGNGFQGIMIGRNATDVAIVDSSIQGFRNGLFIDDPRSDFEGITHSIVNVAISDVDTEIASYAQEILDDHVQIVSPNDIVPGRFEIQLDQPLLFREGHHTDPEAFRVIISGTKTDSLGTTPLPSGTDDYNADIHEVTQILQRNGYFEASDGKKYFVLEDYYSDRITGEIHKFGHLVEISDGINLASMGAVFAGYIDLDNAAPETEGEAVQTAVETDIVIDLLANDSDPDSDAIHIDGIVQPVHGRVFDNGDGTVTYRPDFDFTGTTSFKYWVTDTFGNYTPTVATVTVGEATPEDCSSIDAEGNNHDTASLGATTEEVDHSDHVAATTEDPSEQTQVHHKPHEPGTITGPVIDPAEGDDTFIGTMLNDTINAFSGDEIVRGLAGEDVLTGAAGNDSLFGGGGSDELFGNGGADTIKAGSGADEARGGRGADQILGGGGTDLLFGNGGADTIKAGSGADEV
ncbi:MAG: G8 domain-containing protein, partial [Paracoccaceae bacterium]